MLRRVAFVGMDVFRGMYHHQHDDKNWQAKNNDNRTWQLAHGATLYFFAACVGC
jgi:hypothetical protein